MKNHRRYLWILALFLAPLGQALALEKGRDYIALATPQPVETGAKIEVIEFFWYGCPHCYALEPSVESWSKKLAADVVFRRVPAPLGQSWVPHAQAFYAFETLGVLPKVHRAFFDAIHK